MKRNSFYALTLATTTAIVAGLTLPALAHGDGQGWFGGQGGQQGQANGGMMGGQMGGQMGGSMMGGGQMGGMMQQFDADGDGTVTPDELRTGLTDKLKEFDADGNGSLSLDEFDALRSSLMRERTVDKFQFLDDDGDGQVTADEITKPAEMFERMQTMREQWRETHRKGAGPSGQGQMMQGKGQGQMMQGNGQDEPKTDGN